MYAIKSKQGFIGNKPGSRVDWEQAMSFPDHFIAYNVAWAEARIGRETTQLLDINQGAELATFDHRQLELPL